MYKLYSIPGSCSTGINILLRTLEQDFKIINPAEIADFQTISPTSQVPVLDDDGLLITEGAAIVLYLMEKHNADKVDAPLAEKAEFLRWLMFNCATLHPSYSKMFALNGLQVENPNKALTLQALADRVSKNWAIIDNRLESREFIVGDSVSIIDYLVTIYASWASYFPEQNIVLGDNARDLIKRVSNMPVFKHSYESEGLNYALSS